MVDAHAAARTGDAVQVLRRLLALLVALLVTLALWLLRRTWRVRVVGLERAQGSGVLLACWHGDLVALSAAPLDYSPTLLVSRSRDGSWAAMVARWLGFGVVRGSTSSGAAAGALGLARCLLDGRSVGLAVDGPRGPARHAGGGALRLAARTGARVVPVAAACRRALRLSTWDRLFVPAPFATVHIVFGEPLAGDLQPALEAVAQRATWLAEGGSG